MATLNIFRYTVETREPGDYVDAPGPWRMLYMGMDANEALLEAKEAACQGLTVRVMVEKR